MRHVVPEADAKPKWPFIKVTDCFEQTANQLVYS